MGYISCIHGANSVLNPSYWRGSGSQKDASWPTSSCGSPGERLKSKGMIKPTRYTSYERMGKIVCSPYPIPEGASSNTLRVTFFFRSKRLIS